MDIEVSLAFLGHMVRLHLCIGGGKLREEPDEIEVVEIDSEPAHRLGFQPNHTDDEGDDDDDTEDTTALHHRAPGRLLDRYRPGKYAQR